MKRFVIAAALLACAPAAAAGQFGLRAAEGTTSIFTRDYSLLAVDTEDGSLNLLFTSGKRGRPTEWMNNTQLTLSTSDGTRDLFSGGHWVPGVRLSERAALTRNRGNGGHVTTYGSVAYEVASHALARFSDATNTTLVMEDRTGQTLQLGTGVNWRPSPMASVFGVGAELEWNWGVPESGTPSQVCATQASAPSADVPTVVSQCVSRFFGGVTDARGANLRLDWVGPHWPRQSNAWLERRTTDARGAVETAKLRVAAADSVLNEAKAGATDAQAALREAWQALSAAPGDPARVRAVAEAERAASTAADSVRVRTGRLERANAAKGRADETLAERNDVLTRGPTLTLTGAVSSQLRDGSAPVFNVAIGPSLHPGRSPLSVVGAVLFELSDFTNTQDADWKDRFAVRLYLGVPFGKK